MNVHARAGTDRRENGVGGATAGTENREDVGGEGAVEKE